MIDITRGSILVSNPPPRLKRELSYFRRGHRGEGKYEDLFTMSEDGEYLVTMPGFADRILKMGIRTRVYDRRVRMPDPDIAAAMTGLHECWKGVVSKALENCGGTVSIPKVLGSANMAAAILRAYSRGELVDRGPSMCLVAARDRKAAKSMYLKLRQLLPDREVGLSVGNTCTDSEDVIVTNYASIKYLRPWEASVFIATGLENADFFERAECVSSVKEAARWGIYETPFGGSVDVDIVTEGLFGPSCASATYADAVDGGYAVPITVCWLPMPRSDQMFRSLVYDIINRSLKYLDKDAHDKVLVIDSPKGIPEIPGRPIQSAGDRSFIVAFRHNLDVHNGRPGKLALEDEARKMRFREYGFRQIYFESVDQLPFLGG